MSDLIPTTMTGQVAALWKQQARHRVALSRLAGGSLIWEYQEFTAASGTLTYLPYGINGVHVNGARVLASQYSVDYTTGVVTYTGTFTSGDVLQVDYVTEGGASPGSGGGGALTLTDDFNRAGSYPSGPVVTSGITWEHDAPDFGISSNALLIDGHANNIVGHVGLVGIDVQGSDGTLTLTGLQEASGTYYSGPMWRGDWDSGSSRFVSCWYLASNGDVIQMTELPSQSVTVVSNVGAIPNNATVDVVLAGGNITIKVNGTVVGTIADTFNQTKTYMGLASDVGGGFGSADSFSFAP